MSPPDRGLVIRSAQRGQAAHRQIHLVRCIVPRPFSAAATAHIGFNFSTHPIITPRGLRRVACLLLARADVSPLVAESPVVAHLRDTQAQPTRPQGGHVRRCYSTVFMSTRPSQLCASSGHTVAL
jgi:hypothetical protein